MTLLDTSETQDQDAPVSMKDELIDIAKTVGIALLVAVILRTVFFQPFTIPSASMEPNLYQGDYIFVSKWDYGFSRHSLPFSPPLFKGRIFENQPKRGDIVVFKFPADESKDYIKRIIGLPGDRIQMKHNLLYINDQPVKDVDLGTLMGQGPMGEVVSRKVEETLPNGKRIIIQDQTDQGDLDNTEVYTVPQGYYFAMGDNRDNSIDSRVSPTDPRQPGVGFVPAENLEGKAQLIIVSWNKGAHILKPWTWLDLRWDRFFKSLN